jgi:interferon gamma-inducible protein 30
LYPYGNARQHKSDDDDTSNFPWRFTCQHGPRECRTNIMQACLIDLAKGNTAEYLPAIACMAGSFDPTEAAEECIREWSKLDADAIMDCSKVRYSCLLDMNVR